MYLYCTLVQLWLNMWGDELLVEGRAHTRVFSSWVTSLNDSRLWSSQMTEDFKYWQKSCSSETVTHNPSVSPTVLHTRQCWTGESVLMENAPFPSFGPVTFVADSWFLSVFLLDSFWTNPQFRLKLHGDFLENANDKNIFVSVMQKPDKRRRQKCRKFHIGFSVFEVSLPYGCGSTPLNPLSWRWLHHTSRQDSGPSLQLFVPMT